MRVVTATSKLQYTELYRLQLFYHISCINRKETINTFLKKKNNELFSAYNNFHNILRLFDVLQNFLFTTSETMRNRYLSYKHDIQVDSQAAKRLNRS